MAMSKKDLARKKGKKQEKLDDLKQRAEAGDQAAKKKLAKENKKNK